MKRWMLKHNALEVDLTKRQGTSVEGGRWAPTSSEYTSTCSQKDKLKYLIKEYQKDLPN